MDEIDICQNPRQRQSIDPPNSRSRAARRSARCRSDSRSFSTSSARCSRVFPRGRPTPGVSVVPRFRPVSGSQTWSSSAPRSLWNRNLRGISENRFPGERISTTTWGVIPSSSPSLIRAAMPFWDGRRRPSRRARRGSSGRPSCAANAKSRPERRGIAGGFPSGHNEPEVRAESGQPDEGEHD